MFGHENLVWFYFVLQMSKRSKPNYDWSSFMMDTSSPQSLHSVSTSGNTKKNKMDPVVWIKHHRPRPKSSYSLMEQSARSIAQSWMTDNEANLLDQLKEMETESGGADLFKLCIGSFLVGSFLAAMIEYENGLENIEWRCSVPDLFQAFLIQVFNEWTRPDQLPQVQTRLNRAIRQYIASVNGSKCLNHNVHRLGLTRLFHQINLPLKHDAHCLTYFKMLSKPYQFLNLELAMIYPLPSVLRIDPKLTADLRHRHFALSIYLENKKAKWIAKSTPAQRLQEEKGVDLSLVSYNKQTTRKALMLSNCPTPNHVRMICMTAIAKCHYNGGAQRSLVLAMMALIEPFYMGKHSNSQTMMGRYVCQRLRSDIYWFLGLALTTFYAKLDLPLACFAMAKQSVMNHCRIGPADTYRLALMYQSILVHYGHWHGAQAVFNQWFRLIPDSSWMFEELVLVHVKGIFSQVDDLLIECAITRAYHTSCTNTCHNKHIREPVHKSIEKINELKQRIHECLAKTHVTSNFQCSLQLILNACDVYQITCKKVMNQCLPDAEAEKLSVLYLNIQQDIFFSTSWHIMPFVSQIPYRITFDGYWENLFKRVFEDEKFRWQERTGLKASRRYAEYAFSVAAFIVHHKDLHLGELKLINRALQEALDAYNMCTTDRHYRIPLLQRMIVVASNPKAYVVSEPHPSKPDRHKSGLSEQDITAIGMTTKAIQQFAADTAADALGMLNNDDLLSSEAISKAAPAYTQKDDQFLHYLRQRDEMMPVWISAGLESLRLSPVL